MANLSASNNPRTGTSVTIYLLREGTALEEAFAPNGKYREHAISSNLPFRARLISYPGSENTPSWVSFLGPAEGREEALNPGRLPSLDELRSLSPRAAIALEVGKRVFVVPFGTANRYLISEAKLESNFGLRVALNSIPADSYKSLDSKQISDVILDIRRQASRSTSKDSFSLEEDREQLLTVVGQASAGVLDSRQVVGKDGLKTHVPGTVRELEKLCKDLLILYRGTHYRSMGFGFIDNIMQVREPDIVESLNVKLQEESRKSGARSIAFAPPGVVDWENIGGFKHKGQRSAASELQIEDYLEALGTDETFDLEKAKKHSVRVMNLNGELLERWSVHSCLTCEIRLDSEPDHVFILSTGRWYRIADRYAVELLEFIRQIPNNVVELPDWNGCVESEYNQSASDKKGYVLFDKVLIKPSESSPHSKVEPCDLYCSTGKFIHVKGSRRSSELSHLFAQGFVSLELILNDQKFRCDFRKKLGKGQKDLLPPNKRPKAEELTVVYAILDENDEGAWLDGLPFFSLVNLRSFVRKLRTLGVNVALQRVPKESESPTIKLPPLSSLKTNSVREPKEANGLDALEDVS